MSTLSFFLLFVVYELFFVNEESDDNFDSSMWLGDVSFFGTLSTMVFHEEVVLIIVEGVFIFYWLVHDNFYLVAIDLFWICSEFQGRI